jgi:hypothetical protein
MQLIRKTNSSSQPETYGNCWAIIHVIVQKSVHYLFIIQSKLVKCQIEHQHSLHYKVDGVTASPRCGR